MKYTSTIHKNFLRLAPIPIIMLCFATYMNNSKSETEENLKIMLNKFSLCLRRKGTD